MCHFSLLFCCKHNGTSHSQKRCKISLDYIHMSTPFTLTTFSARPTNVTALSPQSHDWINYVIRRILSTPSPRLEKQWYSRKRLRALSRPAGSLTLSAPEAGDFVELLLLKFIFNRLLQKRTRGRRDTEKNGSCNLTCLGCTLFGLRCVAAYTVWLASWSWFFSCKCRPVIFKHNPILFSNSNLRVIYYVFRSLFDAE